MIEMLEKTSKVIWDLKTDQETIYVEEIEHFREKPIFEFIKRAFDIFSSVIAIILLLIPMAVISIIICAESPGRPIYKQVRLGKNQKPFVIYKFRSMYDGAEINGAQWANEDDARVTKIGRFLRRTKIDELPQLFNILCGQMSVVGPRPERPEFYDVFDTYIVGFRQRTLVKLGLTGYAQVNGGYYLKPEEKIIYDVEYIKKRSLKMDIECILKTVKLVFFCKDTMI